MTKTPWVHNRRVDGRSEFHFRKADGSLGTGCAPVWSTNPVHGCDGSCHLPDFPGRTPKVGDIVVCGAGTVGIITVGQRVRHKYPDGAEALVWFGKRLLPTDPSVLYWTSRNPVVLGFRWDPRTPIDEYVWNNRVEGWPLDTEWLPPRPKSVRVNLYRDMTPEEARDLAMQLNAAADEAEGRSVPKETT